MSLINIDWSRISVEAWYPSSIYEVSDVVMTINRHPSTRNTDESYDIERGLLDLVGEKDFIHRTYEIIPYLMHDAIYVQFTATNILIGMSGHVVRR